MMTLDGGGGSYWGRVEKISGTAMTLQHNASSGQGCFPGGNVCVLDGTATGQCRRIVSCADSNKTAGSSKRHFVLEAPFPTAPDNTSLLTIVGYLGRALFIGNHWADGGSVQLFAQAFDVIVAECKFERMGGLIAWGRSELTSPQYMHGWDPNIHVQFLDNMFIEGQHLWVYNGCDNGCEVYRPGGANTIEPYSIGALSNEQPKSNGDTFTGALNRFLVFTNNSIDSNGGILLGGTSASMLVDRNTVRESDFGILVNASVHEGIVLGKNDAKLEMQGVATVITPHKVLLKV